MKTIIFIITTYFVADISARITGGITCSDVMRINVTVNLLDKGCMKKSSDKASEPIADANNFKVENVEMADYALCLLKKASVLDENGRVNVNFDIFKIIQHLYKKTEKALDLFFIAKTVKECSAMNGYSTPDEFVTAAKIIKCLLENQEASLWCDKYKLFWKKTLF